MMKTVQTVDKKQKNHFLRLVIDITEINFSRPGHWAFGKINVHRIFIFILVLGREPLILRGDISFEELGSNGMAI